MPFLRGRAVLPKGSLFKGENPLSYLSRLENKFDAEKTPLAFAEVQAVLPPSGDTVSRGLTNEDGEFFLRVPSGEPLLVEVRWKGKLLLVDYIPPLSEERIDLGIVDSFKTADALLRLENFLWGKSQQSVSRKAPYALSKRIEKAISSGESLEELPEVRRLFDSFRELARSLDPLGIIENYQVQFLPEEKSLKISFYVPRAQKVNLYYRPFRSRFYRVIRAEKNKGNFFLRKLREFEGYLLYLEALTPEGILAHTPRRSFRVPLYPTRRLVSLQGHQEGPIVSTRMEVNGKRLEKVSGKTLLLESTKALQKNAEIEMDFNFYGSTFLPRFLVREGFQDLEFNLYFPNEETILLGPLNEVPGVLLKGPSWEEIKSWWQKFTPDPPKRGMMEIGFGTPFAELIGYREGGYFRLFSNTDLREKILMISFYQLDSLDLPITTFYWGKLCLFGEGLLKDYKIEVLLEGKFAEIEEDNPPIDAQTVRGQVSLETELTFVRKIEACSI